MLLDRVLYKHPRRRRVHADLLENEKNGSINTAYICTLYGIIRTMMDTKFLELGSANAEGNNLNQKYAKRR